MPTEPTIQNLLAQLDHQDHKLLDIWGRFQSADVGSIAAIEATVGKLAEEMRMLNGLTRQAIRLLAEKA